MTQEAGIPKAYTDEKGIGLCYYCDVHQDSTKQENGCKVKDCEAIHRMAAPRNQWARKIMAKDADFIERAASTKGGSITATLMPATDKLKPKGHTNEDGPITATSHPHKHINFHPNLAGATRVMGGLQDLEVQNSADHDMVKHDLEVLRGQLLGDRQLETFEHQMKIYSDLAFAELEKLTPTLAMFQRVSGHAGSQ